jgi:hypothetical protein
MGPPLPQSRAGLAAAKSAERAWFHEVGAFRLI